MTETTSWHYATLLQQPKAAPQSGEVGSFEVYKRWNRFHLPETFNGKTDVADLIRFLYEYDDYCTSRQLPYDSYSVRHFVAVETFGLENRQQVFNYVLSKL